MSKITIVGGGVAGLTSAIACAEGGADVTLIEAHDELGGRARSTSGSYKANLGPHALQVRRQEVASSLRAAPLESELGDVGVRQFGGQRQEKPNRADVRDCFDIKRQNRDHQSGNTPVVR